MVSMERGAHQARLKNPWTSDLSINHHHIHRARSADSVGTTLSNPFVVDGELASSGTPQDSDDEVSFAPEKIDRHHTSIVRDDSTIDDTGDTAVSSLLQKYHYDSQTLSDASTISDSVEVGRPKPRLHRKFAMQPLGPPPSGRLPTPSFKQSRGFIVTGAHSSGNEKTSSPSPTSSYGSTSSLLRLSRPNIEDVDGNARASPQSIPSMWRITESNSSKNLSPIPEGPVSSRPVSSVHSDWETVDYTHRDRQSRPDLHHRVSSEEVVPGLPTSRATIADADDDGERINAISASNYKSNEGKGKEIAPAEEDDEHIYSSHSAGSSLPRSPRIAFQPKQRARQKSTSSSPLSHNPAAAPFVPLTSPPRATCHFDNVRTRLWNEQTAAATAVIQGRNPFVLGHTRVRRTEHAPLPYIGSGGGSQEPEAILMEPLARLRTPVFVRQTQPLAEAQDASPERIPGTVRSPLRDYPRQPAVLRVPPPVAPALKSTAKVLIPAPSASHMFTHPRHAPSPFPRETTLQATAYGGSSLYEYEPRPSYHSERFPVRPSAGGVIVSSVRGPTHGGGRGHARSSTVPSDSSRRSRLGRYMRSHHADLRTVNLAYAQTGNTRKSDSDQNYVYGQGYGQSQGLPYPVTSVSLSTSATAASLGSRRGGLVNGLGLNLGNRLSSRRDTAIHDSAGSNAGEGVVKPTLKARLTSVAANTTAAVDEAVDTTTTIIKQQGARVSFWTRRMVLVSIPIMLSRCRWTSRSGPEFGTHRGFRRGLPLPADSGAGVGFRFDSDVGTGIGAGVTTGTGPNGSTRTGTGVGAGTGLRFGVLTRSSRGGMQWWPITNWSPAQYGMLGFCIVVLVLIVWWVITAVKH